MVDGSINFDALKRTVEFVGQRSALDAATLDTGEFGPSQPFSMDYVETPDNFVGQRFVSLPEIMVRQLDKLQSKCFLGLFPEIDAVWMTVDSSLFVWMMKKTTDNFLSYTQLSDIITAVSIVVPRKNVFVDQIRYVFVVSTITRIVVLGFRESGSGEYDIIDIDMSVSSDGVVILNIVGTLSGRIFMSGNNGHLYELVYGATENWFGQKCWKIDHSSSLLSYFVPTLLNVSSPNVVTQMAVDITRSQLVCLLEQNTIQVFRFDNNTKFEQVCRIKNIYDRFSVLCPQSLLFKKQELVMVSVHVLTIQESMSSFFALTVSGIRLYFRVFDTGSWSLTHVRFPHQNSRSKHSFGMGHLNFHLSYYNRGVLLAAHGYSDNEDILWRVGFNEALKHGQSGALESHSTCGFKGKTWAIAEQCGLGTQFRVFQNDETARKICELGKFDEYFDQHSSESRVFLVLFSTGIQVLERPRPVDVLERLLTESKGQHSKEVDLFLDQYTRDEQCYLLLLLLNQRAKEKNSRMHVLLWASNLFVQRGGDPVAKSQGVEFSSKFNAMIMYFWRSTRRIWRLEFGRMRIDKEFVSRMFVSVQEDLKQLGDFIEKSLKIYPVHKVPQQSAYEIEARQMDNLRYLVQYTIQGLSLLSILIDQPIGELADRLGAVLAVNIDQVTVEEFLSSVAGYEIIKEITSGLVFMQGERHSSWDALLDIVTFKSPMFFNHSDTVYFKAKRTLESVKTIVDSGKRQDVSSRFLALLKDPRVAIYLGIGRISDLAEDCRLCNLHSCAIEFIDFVRKHRESDGDVLIQILFGLLEDAQTLEPALFENALDMALLSDDKVFHDKLYSWMIEKQWFGHLVQARSKFIEDFLTRYHSQGMSSELDGLIFNRDLLWKYHVHNNRHWEASRILFELAESANVETLDQRIELLSLARINAKAVKEPRTETGLEEIEDHLDVAGLQQEIYSVLQQKESCEPELELLNSKICSLSELYNQIALPHQLWGICLKIIHMAGYSENPGLVIRCWTKLLETEIDKSANLGCIVTQAKNLIIEYGQTLSRESIAFPAEFLCQFLEGLFFDCSLRNGTSNQGWGVEILLDAGVSFDIIYETLYNLLVSRVSPWDTRESMAFLVHDMVFVLEAWYKSCSFGGALRDLPRMVETCDRLSSILKHSKDPSLAGKLDGLKQKLQSV